MDLFLKSLKKSIDHLLVIDKILSTEDHANKELYLEIKEKLLELNKGDPNDPDNKDALFTDILYVGGKKIGKKSYSRHMILADIIEYIFLGRGYHYVNESNISRKKVFIELILYTINLLLIIDSLTVQVNLRKKLLKALVSDIGDSFFKENDMKELHHALLLYEGDIGFDIRDKSNLTLEIEKILRTIKGEKSSINKLWDYYDSLLPKTGGGLWNELIVFFYLLRRTSVFIIPLLLTQRILSKEKILLKPPDFLVIDKEKTLYGIEVGGGKESQSSDFAYATGIRMLTTQNTNIPPRCPICGEWILFCPKVIEDCRNIDSNPLLRIHKEVRCAHECYKYSTEDVINGKCPYIQYHGNVTEETKNKSKQNIKFDTSYHYHYSCIRKIKDQNALNEIERQYERWKNNNNMDINNLKTNYPYISGIKNLEKLKKHEIICYGKYPNLDIKNCESCEFIDKCKRFTRIMKIIDKDNTLTVEDENKLKDLLKEIFE